MKPTRKNRNQAFIRYQRQVAIAHKKKIALQTHWLIPNQQYGRLAKNKVHCSCSLCKDKTVLNGFPKSQTSRLLSQVEQIKEYQNSESN